MSNGTTAIPVSPVADMIAALHAGEAAKARVPELEAARADLANKLDAAQYHNQRLEENILAYKNTIADLTSKVRSLEVERDDASFRVLETEDKFDKLKAAIRHATGDLDATLMQVDPPKPEPKPVGEVTSSAATAAASELSKPYPQGSSEADPTASTSQLSGSQTADSANSAGTASALTTKQYEPFVNPSEGSQSKPDPSVDTTQGPSQNATTATEQGATDKSYSWFPAKNPLA